MQMSHLAVSGALSHSADITIDVADNKTLTYSGTAISLGANTLTLSGGGSLVSGGLTLNDASSKLLLNSITVDNVSTSADSLGLDVDNADSTSYISLRLPTLLQYQLQAVRFCPVQLQ